jgi:hypothetical protein
VDVYGLRRACVGNPAVQRGVLAAGMVLVGLAVVLVDAHRWPWPFITLVLGVVVFWAGGWLVVPHGRDSYAKRMTRIVNDWFGELALHEREGHAASAARLEQAEAIIPEPNLAGEHARLLGALREEYRARCDHDQPFADRLETAAAAHAHIKQLAARHADRPYGVAVQGLIGAPSTPNTMDDASRRALARLSRVRPWRGAAVEHRALMDAYRAYAAGIQDAAVATEGGDRAAARTAGAREEAACQDVGACATALNERLELERRWGLGAE